MAKVFWTDYRTSYKENIADKLRRLLENSDFVDIDFKKNMLRLKCILVSSETWPSCARTTRK